MPRAYNHSIYLMMGMPYLLFGVIGFLVYRGCKKNAAFQQANGQLPNGVSVTDEAQGDE